MPLSAGAALEYVSFCDIGNVLDSLLEVQPSFLLELVLSGNCSPEVSGAKFHYLSFFATFCNSLSPVVSTHSHQCKWGGLCCMLFSWQNSLGFRWESLLQSRWGRGFCVKPSGAQSCVPMWEEESSFLKPVVPVQYPRKVSGVCWLFFSAKWLHNCVSLWGQSINDTFWMDVRSLVPIGKLCRARLLILHNCADNVFFNFRGKKFRLWYSHFTWISGMAVEL